MSFQYVSSMRLPLRRNQAATVDPSAETLSIDGSAQMYLRDPAGNLVEVDWPDASTLDREVVVEIALLADERPQSDEARRARLYLAPAAPGEHFRRLKPPGHCLALGCGGVLVSPSLASTSVSLGRALRIAGLVLLALVIAFPIVWVLFIASETTFGPAVDDPKDFLITLLNGVTAAALYFIVASGFTLIFGLMRVVNMAHGAFFLLGGYIALELQRDLVPGAGSALGISSAQVSFMNWFLPLLAAGLIVGGVGLLMQQAFLRWNQGQELRQALITIAISIIAADQMLAHFGGVAKDISWPRTFDKFLDLQVADVQYTLTRLVILGIGLAHRGSAVVLAQAHAHRDGDPGGRRRPRHGLRPRGEHPADVRDRLLHRVGARRHRGRHGRLVRQPRARGRRATGCSTRWWS